MRIKHLFAATAIASVLSFSFVSCSDDDDFNPEAVLTTKDLSKDSKTNNSKGTVTEKASGVFELRNFQQFALDENGNIVIEDVEIKVDDKVVDVQKKEKTSATYYFDFAKGDAATEEDHSISFSGTTRVEVKPNVGAGYELSLIDDKAFADVKSGDTFTPAENNVSAIRSMDWEGKTRPLSEHGWCDYFGATHEVRPVANRTLVLLKDGKAIYKFKINSIYQDETPIDFKNFVFYSIDYQAL